MSKNTGNKGGAAAVSPHQQSPPDPQLSAWQTNPLSPHAEGSNLVALPAQSELDLKFEQSERRAAGPSDPHSTLQSQPNLGETAPSSTILLH